MINRLREVSNLTWSIVGVIVLLGGIIGGWIYFWSMLEANFADIAIADEVRLHGVRLEQKIVQDNITFTRREIRQLVKDCKTNNPQAMRRDSQKLYYKLEDDLKKFNSELNLLNQKQ